MECKTPRSQSGAATILMAAIMLFSITLVAIYGARFIVTEQRIAYNYKMDAQARHAAEAGLDYGLNNLTWNLVSTGSNTIYTDIGTPRTTTVNGKTVSTHTAKFKLLTAGNYTTVEVVGTGTASDGATSRQYISLAKFVPTIGYTSPAALTVHGNVSANSSVSLANTVQDVGIWAGGTLTGSPTVTVSPGAGDGIYTNDADLAALSNDGFFENYFSESKDTIRGRATRVDCTTPCNASDPKIQALVGQGGLIWIDGDLTLDSAITLGSSTDPVILVVNGNFTMNHTNAEVFGQLYVAGDWNNGTGGGRVFGTAMVEGNFSAGGPLQFSYDAPTLGQTATLGIYAKIPGSWRDF